MKKYFLLLFFCLLIFNLSAQIIFNDNSSPSLLGVYYLDNCSFSDINGRINRRNWSDGHFSDIALHPDGRLFATTGATPTYYLVEIDVISKNILDTLAEVPGPAATSLLCGPSGIFYTGYGNMYSYKIGNEEMTFLGGVPGGILFGDLVFLNGALYGATGPPNSNSETPGAVYRFNLTDLSQSERVVVLPEDVFFLAMTVVWDEECKEQKIIGNDAVPGEFGRFTNTLYEVDLESGQITPLCEQIDFGTVSSERIWGLTSPDEFRTNCRLQLDLDVNDNSGRLIDHFLLDSLCTTVFPIADDDVRALSMDGPLDSIVVEVVGGIQHLGEEYLEVDSVPLFEVKGLGSTRLSLHNRGQAQLSDVEEAVHRVRFHIAAEQPLSGERKLFTRLYVNGEASDPAKSFIRANYDERPSAGEDAYVELCEYKARNLFNELGGAPRPTGRWEPAFFDQRMPNFFNSWHDPPGIYHYIVQEGGCVADTAEVEVVVFPDPNISATDDPLDKPIINICQGDSLVWDPTFEGGHSYNWGDIGSEEIIRAIKEEGHYSVEAYDSHNCHWFASAYINVLEEESVRTDEKILHCLAEPYQWQGQAVTRDTTICEVYPRVNGCDSTHCVTIDIQPPLVRNNSITSCNNRPITYNNVVYEQDTILCDTLLSAAGCDSLRCVQLIFYDRSESRRVEEICRGESVRIGGKLYSESGLYGDTVQLANGCDSFALTELVVHPTYEIHLDSTIKPGQEVAIGDQRFAFPGRWQVLLESREGCDSLVVLDLEVDSTSSVVDLAASAEYYAPTILSRAEGTTFTLFSRSNSAAGRIELLEIVNLWGQPVFRAENIPVGDPVQGWRPGLAESGLYLFRARMKAEGKEPQVLVGRLVVME